ncbi:hypothetical protein K9M59_01110 [Candidatus Gracilibacteria bacterium]|nr:hypothetical protein [Candidatus Gracilibacteria bacterium]MCF7819167.1 hypothetical protein [Candidatus Gracilibacteria bacterium]
MKKQILDLLEGDQEKKLDSAKVILDNMPLFFNSVIQEAKTVHLEHFSPRILLYAISYISDVCISSCQYCGHSKDNARKRRRLSLEEIEKDFSAVLQYHPQELCVLAGEDPKIFDHFIEAIKILNKLNPHFDNCLQLISLNIAPLDKPKFEKIIQDSQSKIPLQFRIFQETYDREEYTRNHTDGPKTNFDFRYSAQERALSSGFQSVGIGALLGINSKGTKGNNQEILSLIAHAYDLKTKTGQFPESVAIPRLQPIPEQPSPKNFVEDKRYIFYLGVLRLALPTVKIYITAREVASFIETVEPFINVRDLAPRPCVGGNINGMDITKFQNLLGDSRSAKEIINDLKNRNKI